MRTLEDILKMDFGFYFMPDLDRWRRDREGLSPIDLASDIVAVRTSLTPPEIIAYVKSLIAAEDEPTKDASYGLGWIAVDLDGCLAHYDGWKGIFSIGDPVPEMARRVRAWLAEKKDVRIFTARVSEGSIAKRAIHLWLVRHFGRVLPVTNVKDMKMKALWDDRAVAVEKNTGRIIGGAADLI